MTFWCATEVFLQIMNNLLLRKSNLIEINEG